MADGRRPVDDQWQNEHSSASRRSRTPAWPLSHERTQAQAWCASLRGRAWLSSEGGLHDTQSTHRMAPAAYVSSQSHEPSTVESTCSHLEARW
eukprot:6961403-Pyramimonas_sp.AAC.1